MRQWTTDDGKQLGRARPADKLVHCLGAGNDFNFRRGFYTKIALAKDFDGDKHGFYFL